MFTFILTGVAQERVSSVGCQAKIRTQDLTCSRRAGGGGSCVLAHMFADRDGISSGVIAAVCGNQCYGSGSRIQHPVLFYPLDPDLGSGMEKIRIRVIFPRA
jgi:hypothetical protein